MWPMKNLACDNDNKPPSTPLPLLKSAGKKICPQEDLIADVQYIPKYMGSILEKCVTGLEFLMCLLYPVIDLEPTTIKKLKGHNTCEKSNVPPSNMHKAY